MNSDVTKQFAVNWNNHMNHVKKAFDSLLNNCELTDVTLYAEGRKVGAHKMLLSACSAYFRSLFKEFPQEHPIVVLKGISYPVLSDILKFIYNGEVSVDSDVFDSFLQTAEFLQISGLTDGEKNPKKVQNSDSDVEKEDPNDDEIEQPAESKTCKKEKRPNSDCEQNVNQKRIKEDNSESPAIKCEPSVLTAIFPDELSDTLQENSQFSSDLLLQTAAANNYPVDETGIKIEDVNSEGHGDDASSSSSARTSSFALSDNPLKCPICHKEFSHPYSLHHHKPVHLGGTKCPICHAVLSRKYNLKMHMKSRHNVV
ncbi:hypothetical protein NQ318_020026 [Aromia moschata]|uniref:Broad-complex n=1 Tax=Aromia moschata TaxID=1265417 RepID=A0AAV8Z957_9CUCU|nr:hypothetical protein NQ318_020026 [Aromia moschata]